MRTKRKSNLGNISRRKFAIQEARKFLWHLQTNWRDKFDHDLWWNETDSKATQEAAMWEVLRRHPQTEILLRSTKLSPAATDTERFLSLYGTQSWQTLSNWDAKFVKFWKRSLPSLPPQWGIAVSDSYDIVDITNDEIASLGARFHKSFREMSGGNRPEDRFYLNALKLWNSREMSDGIQVNSFKANYEAFNILFSGGVLIGFDLKKPGIANLVQEKVRQLIKEAYHTNLNEASRKSYWEAWLGIIKRFENEELRRGRQQNRNGQLFARYRRIFRDRPLM